MNCPQCSRMKTQIAAEKAAVTDAARKLARGGHQRLFAEVTRRKAVIAENQRWLADHQEREHAEVVA